MFRAAFLRKVPLFVRDFAENVLLCLVAAGVESTSRRFLERLKLFWRAKLTERIHRQYFSSMARSPAALTRVLWCQYGACLAERAPPAGLQWHGGAPGRALKDDATVDACARSHASPWIGAMPAIQCLRSPALMLLAPETSTLFALTCANSQRAKIKKEGSQGDVRPGRRRTTSCPMWTAASTAWSSASARTSPSSATSWASLSASGATGAANPVF